MESECDIEELPRWCQAEHGLPSLAVDDPWRLSVKEGIEERLGCGLERDAVLPDVRGSLRRIPRERNAPKRVEDIHGFRAYVDVYAVSIRAAWWQR